MHEFLHVIGVIVLVLLGMASASFLYSLWRGERRGRDLGGWDDEDYDSGCAP